MTGTDARDSTVVLLEVVCHFYRIVLDHCVEIRKQDYKNEIRNNIQPACSAEGFEESIPEATRLLIDEHIDRAGDRKDGACKDYGENAAERNLDRKVAGLSAVHLSADNSLCVLDRDTSFRVLHEGDDPNNSEEDDDPKRNKSKELCCTVNSKADILSENGNCIGQSRHDTREKQDRDTVSDTVLIDLLAKPHHYCSTRSKRKDDNEGCKPHREARIIGCNAGILQIDEVSSTLEQTKCNRYITSDGSDLLAAALAFLSQFLKGRNGYSKELHNNGAVDVRGYTHCEYRRV